MYGPCVCSSVTSRRRSCMRKWLQWWKTSSRFWRISTFGAHNYRKISCMKIFVRGIKIIICKWIYNVHRLSAFKKWKPGSGNYLSGYILDIAWMGGRIAFLFVFNVSCIRSWCLVHMTILAPSVKGSSLFLSLYTCISNPTPNTSSTVRRVDTRNIVPGANMEISREVCRTRHSRAMHRTFWIRIIHVLMLEIQEKCKRGTWILSIQICPYTFVVCDNSCIQIYRFVSSSLHIYILQVAIIVSETWSSLKKQYGLVTSCFVGYEKER
jgi:hypothetical protein